MQQPPFNTATSDVAYGPHDRNRFDLWQGQDPGPHPLVVHIHGGGWSRGDKAMADSRVHTFLDRGISVASINYRLIGEAPLPAPVHDAARAIQFLRLHAAEYKIDPARIAVTGGSAGACTALWLALHKDMANPQSDDPVARQSSRVIAAGVAGAQTSIDPGVIESWLGEKAVSHSMIWASVGAKSKAEALDNYPQYESLYKEFSPINHLTPDAPPLYLIYDNPPDLPPRDIAHAIHHPEFGHRLQKAALAAGVECHIVVTSTPNTTPYDTIDDFLIAKVEG